MSAACQARFGTVCGVFVEVATQPAAAAAQRAPRLVLGHPDPLTRHGLAALLHGQGFSLLALAGDRADLERRIAGHRPDVVVAHASLAGDHPPDCGLVLLADPGSRPPLPRVERIGRLLTDRLTDPRALADAIRAVHAGGSAIHPAPPRPVDSLSGREREVLALMADGLSNTAIAERLFITVRTVEAHTKAIYGRLGIEDELAVNRRVAAVLNHVRAA